MTEFARIMQSLKSAGLFNRLDGKILYNNVISVDHVIPKHSYRPFRKKECFSNAVKLLEKTRREDAWYCEGYVSVNNSTPIEHAWVILGYSIIDPTFEVALDMPLDKINKEEYYLLKKYPLSEVYENLLKFKKYGPWWNK
ncbi:MAG: hypothetical protein J1F35_06325 [Erysipelotrichales bacterium]|nr:hypothetical protein [Erysipelotrichales bacterium]